MTPLTDFRIRCSLGSLLGHMLSLGERRPSNSSLNRRAFAWSLRNQANLLMIYAGGGIDLTYNSVIELQRNRTIVTRPNRCSRVATKHIRALTGHSLDNYVRIQKEFLEKPASRRVGKQTHDSRPLCRNGSSYLIADLGRTMVPLMDGFRY